MTLYVRDEEDIVSYNIDFHLKMGVDFFIVTDNLSQDGTSNILKKYEAAGVLKYYYSDDHTHSQYRHVTKMAREAFTEYKADWVINNDADEFWLPKGGANLKDVFNSFPANVKAVLFNRINFVPLRFYSDPFYKEMIYRQVMSKNWLGSPLPGKTAHRGDPWINVAQGNHSVFIDGPIPGTLSGDIEILHFTGRAFDRFERSIAFGGKAYEQNKVLGKECGIVRRTLYEEYKLNGDLTSFYGREYYTRERVERELKKGKIITDKRICDFFD